mgnify:CR=1 FL=1
MSDTALTIDKSMHAGVDRAVAAADQTRVIQATKDAAEIPEPAQGQQQAAAGH